MPNAVSDSIQGNYCVLSPITHSDVRSIKLQASSFAGSFKFEDLMGSPPAKKKNCGIIADRIWAATAIERAGTLSAARRNSR